MKNTADLGTAPGWPSAGKIAALRAFHAGLDSRAAVARYLPDCLGAGRSARGTLGGIRRALLDQARRRHRSDLLKTLARAGRDQRLSAAALQQSLDALSNTPLPEPSIGDEVARWFSPRISRSLVAHGIRTLAELTVRIPRLKGWWRAIEGLGAVGAGEIERFFAAHPVLTDRARALVTFEQEALIPWERLRVPNELDGSKGAFRAPRRACVLSANNDHQAVQAWLQLHESGVTQRAYRKEAERLILWSIIERGRALSSLTTEDAIAYRHFLKNPAPRRRWIGPAAPRTSPAWRPFQRPLSPRSAAYALSVVNALYRWLMEQRYVLANPFAGVRVRAAKSHSPAARAFSEEEWLVVRGTADRLEYLGWSESAAQRIKFVLDFACATGLRSSELVGATLRDIGDDEAGNRWISVVGKGNKAGRVAVPPRARLALDRYLAARGLSTDPRSWSPKTPLVPSLLEDGTRLTGSRLWAVMKRFFAQVANGLESRDPTLAHKLRLASPHWMRHTHATHALSRGVALPMVRDNLRHASISTTSTYLHSDERRRANEFATAFGLSHSEGSGKRPRTAGGFKKRRTRQSPGT